MTFYARNLPHWLPEGRDIFITWRLSGSLPAHFKLRKNDPSAGKQFLDYDRQLDTARTGPMWLNDPVVVESLIAALQNGQARAMYRVHSYVVMCNHVHVLIEPKISVAKITKSIKGATARGANRVLGRQGTTFWQDESFDHWIRTPQEWQRIRAYIENNPVAAGLVAKPDEWPWSSASRPIV